MANRRGKSWAGLGVKGAVTVEKRSVVFCAGSAR